MHDFDRIVGEEKKRSYKLDNQDQFVFDTLAAIHSSKTRKLRRVAVLSVSIILCLVIGIQIVMLQQASFSQLITQIELIITQRPQYLAMFNLGFIALILGLKRLRVF